MTADVQEAIRRLIDSVEAIDIDATMQLARRRSRARVRITAAVVAAACAAAVVGVVVVRSEVRGNGAVSNRANHTTSFIDGVKPNTVRRVSTAPIAGRIGPAAVWDGREMIIWGGSVPKRMPQNGETPFDDGATYNPKSNSWRKLPAAPIKGRAYANVVWTGAEMIVSGGEADGTALADGAAYNPHTRRWRRIASAPVPTMKSITVWTGAQVITVGGLNHGGDTLSYNPSTNAWRRLSDGPGGITPPYPQGAWTGRTLVAILDEEGTGPFGQPIVASYDPTSDRWQVVHTFASDQYLHYLVNTGPTTLVLTAGGDGGTIDNRTLSWSSGAAAIPDRESAGYTPVWVDGNAVFWPGGARSIVFNLARHSWEHYTTGALRARSDGAFIAAGEVAIAWGGFYNLPTGGAAGDNEGVIVRPPSSRATERPSVAPTTTTTEHSSEPQLPTRVREWLRAYAAQSPYGHAVSADWVYTTHGKASLVVGGVLPSNTDPVYLFDVHGSFVWNHSCPPGAPPSACVSRGTDELFTLDPQRLEILDFTVRGSIDLARFGNVGHVQL